MSALPSATRFLEGELGRGGLLGAEVVVLRGEDPVAHVTVGYATESQRLRPTSLWHWGCAVKPLLALATAALADREDMSLDAPVATVLPEFGVNGKERVHIRQLLDNTSGLPLDPPGSGTWREALPTLYCEAPAPGHIRGHVSYSTTAWYVVAALIERLSGVDFVRFLQDEILIPLAMHRTHLGPARDPGASPAVAQHVQIKGRYRPLPANKTQAVMIPGVTGFGAIGDLALFYRELGRTARGEGSRWDASMLCDMIQVKQYGHDCYRECGRTPFAAGFVRDMRKTFNGRHCSEAAFGHGATLASNKTLSAFADPLHDLSVVYAINGLRPGGNFRYMTVGSLIYEDLGLC